MMNVQWDPLFSPLPALIAGVLLAFLFGYFEFRKSIPLLGWRLLALTTMALALFMLILRPSTTIERNSSSVLLLTAGYDRLAADSILRTKAPQVVTAPGVESLADAEAMKHWGKLNSLAPKIRYVLGEGIPPYANQSELRYDFIPSKSDNGIVRLHIPTVRVNRPGFVTGMISGAAGGTLVLRGPGGTEDSVQIGREGQFSLRFIPRNAGNWLYGLSMKSGAMIVQEKVPVHVQPVTPLSVLILQQFPTFESRQLKAFLSDQGHAVAIRSQVSQNRYRTEFTNRAAQKIDRITPALLSGTDLLIATEGTIQTLSGGEWEAIQKGISDRLGFLVLMDDGSERVKAIVPAKPVERKLDTVSVTLPFTQKRVSLHTTTHAFAPDDQFEPLLTDETGQLCTGFFHLGAGKVGVQLLTSTSRLALEGASDDYAGIWVPLIDAVARETQGLFRIKINASLPLYPDEPIPVEVIGTGVPPQLWFDDIRVPLREGLTLDDVYDGIVIGKQGWHTLRTQDSTSVSLYISNNGDLHALRIADQQALNHSKGPGLDRPLTKELVQEPVSPWIFFIVFVIAAGFLWLSPKL